MAAELGFLRSTAGVLLAPLLVINTFVTASAVTITLIGNYAKDEKKGRIEKCIRRAEVLDGHPLKVDKGLTNLSIGCKYNPTLTTKRMADFTRIYGDTRRLQ